MTSTTRWALALALFCLGCPGWLGAQPPMRGNPELLVGFAHYLREKGDHYRAEGEYRAFLLLFPDHPRVPEALFFLGKTCQNQRNWPAAMEAFLKAWASGERPWSGQGALAVGEVLLEAGQAKEAAQHLERLAEDPEHGELREPALWLAMRSWLVARNWEKAEAALLDVDESHPSAQEARRLAARIREESSRLPSREPWVAAGLSAVLPGAGHLYAGKHLEALTSLVLNAAFVLGSLWSAKEGCWLSSGILSFLELNWYLGGIQSASEAARSYNRQQEERWIKELGQGPLPEAASPSTTADGLWLLGWKWRF
ncbi:MAG: tetratricopeptide repeat protein [Thermodesulfobacteriota bacterium]